MNQLTCPITTCRAENDIVAEVCIQCGTPLSAYRKLFMYPTQLFNKGLEVARQGQTKQARDLFAAVVYWCPKDREARNALALACYTLKDFVEARRHWENILTETPQDVIAKQGIKALEVAIQKEHESQANTATMKRARNKLRSRKIRKLEVLHRG